MKTGASQAAIGMLLRPLATSMTNPAAKSQNQDVWTPGSSGMT